MDKPMISPNKHAYDDMREFAKSGPSNGPDALDIVLAARNEFQAPFSESVPRKPFIHKGEKQPFSGGPSRDGCYPVWCGKCQKYLATALAGAEAWCDKCSKWTPIEVTTKKPPAHVRFS